MQFALRKIDALTNVLRALEPIKPDNQKRLDKKIRLDFNYNSNHIEGNTLTYSETELLLIFDKTIGNHEMREYEEMKAHDLAFQIVKNWAKDTERPLTESAIKELHEILLVRPFWKASVATNGQTTKLLIRIGTYKEQPNFVKLPNGETLDYTSPADTPIEMGELIEWLRNEEENSHPLVLAAMLHHKFVRIHPFDDGNGRIARLLMNYVLLRNNLPPVIIKSADKKDYLFALAEADANRPEAFINYIAEQLVWSLELSIKAAKGESIDEPGDLERKLALLKKELGHEPEAIVRITYGPETVAKTIDDTLMDLAEAWDDKLQLFDPLFLSRYVIISDEQHSTRERLAQDALGVHYNSYYHENKKKFPVKRLNFVCSLNGLQSAHKNLSVNGGEIRIEFHENAFVVAYGAPQTLKKLYHQKLTIDEIQLIVDFIGNRTFTYIEKFVDSSSTEIS